MSLPPSVRTSEVDFNNKITTVKNTPTVTTSTLECNQSTKIQSTSESTDLDMDDPLQSPTLTSSIAYLEERDLIPPITPGISIFFIMKFNFESFILDVDLHPPTNDDMKQLHELLDTAIDKKDMRQFTNTIESNSTSTNTNLSC